jgi:amidase
MPYFGQELFEDSEKTATHDSAAYEKRRLRNRNAAGPDGIDRLLRRYSVDALIAPTTSPAFPIDFVNGDHILGGAMTLAAVSGYPHLTVPMGQIQGLPLGISFVGPAWSEATLLAMGYAFEQRAAGRSVPTFPASIALPVVSGSGR